jgi:putative acetyltransferase
MPATQPHIRPFRAGVDEAAFRSLNEAWLKKYFRVEPKDAELFDDPIGQFIMPGGDILMLDADGATVGCCALINLGEGTFEIAKMAVAESHQRRGYGELLLRAIIDRAHALGARRLFIESSSKLPAAIALYRKLGFDDVPAAEIPPSDFARVDVFMERML